MASDHQSGENRAHLQGWQSGPFDRLTQTPPMPLPMAVGTGAPVSSRSATIGMTPRIWQSIPMPKALAALRDGLASDTLDGKKLDTLADAASAELKTTAADVEKDLPAGKLREVFSQVLTTVVEMNKNRYGAAFSGLSGVRACIKENQHDATCRDLCNMLQDPRSADLPAIKKGIADTTAFCAAK